MVGDEERGQRLGHLAVDVEEAVSELAEELGAAPDVDVHLAVGVDVLPRHVLHVRLHQSPRQVAVQLTVESRD